jgi:cytoskeletal protein CcmA (bactofilin family)/ribosomal protein S27E
MADAPRKAPFACPECGFVQQESIHLISTYCRSCGCHYNVQAAQRVPAAAPTRPASRVVRPVQCHRCGEGHEVSPHAQTTICPGCGQSITFGDITVTSNDSRPVDTRGTLIIEETGHLMSMFTVCGDATIHGRVSGTLVSEGAVRLHTVGRLSVRLRARTVIVEKGAQVDFLHPVECRRLEVFGGASGRFECSGAVQIGRGGQLEGRFRARSIVVDQGGALLAQSSVESVLDREES